MERAATYNMQHTGQIEVTVLAGTQFTAVLVKEIEQLRRRLRCTADLRTSLSCLLGTVNNARRRPVLVTLRQEAQLIAVVLLFELRFAGLGSGVYLGGDLVGDGLLIGNTQAKDEYLNLAIGALFRARPFAHSVRLCLPAAGGSSRLHASRIEASLRKVQRRLPLAATFAEMLASFGAHTRRHLQRKRVLLESKGKVAFWPSLSPSHAFEGMIALNHVASVPRSLSQHSARFAMLNREVRSYCMGLQLDGEWLSLISGWRDAGRTYIDLQINNSQFEKDSISGVMRSYFMEQEIKLGQKELFFVGGCSLLLQRYCVNDEVCTDVVLRRGVFRTKAVEWAAGLVAPKKLVEYIYQPLSLGSTEDQSTAVERKPSPVLPEKANAPFAVKDQSRATSAVLPRY